MKVKLFLFLLIGVFVSWIGNTCFATEFPGSGDWSSGMKVLDLGSTGQWDDSDIQLGSAVVWRDTIFIFYMGCSTCRPEGDCGYGDIGVAKSVNGTTFTKHPGNPVITNTYYVCSPRDDEEVVEFPQVAVTELNEFVLYCAVNEANTGCGGTDTDVDSDIYVFVSSGDPYNFDSGTMVIGSAGEAEFWPIGVYYGDAGTGGTAGKWHLWITGNQSPINRTAYLYYGDTCNSLTEFGQVASGYTSESMKPIYHASDDSMTMIYTYGPGGGTPCYRNAYVRTSHVDNIDNYSSNKYTLGSGLCWRAGNAIIADTSAQLWRFYYRYVASGPSDCNGEIWMKTALGTFNIPNQPPTASFTATPDSGNYSFPLNVYFDASTSSDPDGVIDSFYWDFGDGADTTITVDTITHTYDTLGSGTYICSLEVTDDSLATASYNDTLTFTSDFHDTTILVPLTITDRAGLNRINEPITFGVPFAQGVLDPDTVMRVLSGGEPYPCQIQATSHWSDGSVRWLLVDFQADVAASSDSVYALTDGGIDSIDNTLSATEDADSIVVITGPLKFIVSRTKFNLFDRLWLDKNDNGSYEASEEMIASDSTNGAIVAIDGSTNVFSSAKDENVTVAVVDSGSQRIVILAEGLHEDINGNRGLDFTCWIHAFSGQSFVKVQYTFYNRQDSTITDWIDVTDISLKTNVSLSGETYYAIAGSAGTVHEDTLAGTDSVSIYAYGTTYGGSVSSTSFDTLPYIIGGGNGGNGRRARGYSDISDTGWGTTVVIEKFWQHHPKGVEVSADGEIFLRMVPVYYDDSGSVPISQKWDSGVGATVPDTMSKADKIYSGAAKTHDVWFYFHGDGWSASVESVATRFENPLFALATAGWYCSTFALGRILPADTNLIQAEHRQMMAEFEYMADTLYEELVINRDEGYNEYGMWNFGDDWDAGPGWTNIHYDLPRFLFMQTARTGSLKYFDLAVEQCKHYRDVDIVHLVGEFGTDDRDHGGVNRSRPNNNHGLGEDGHGWTAVKGPGLALHYLLTGDRQSLYGSKQCALFVRNGLCDYSLDNIMYDPRHLGQGLEAMLAHYQATDSTIYLDNDTYRASAYPDGQPDDTKISAEGCAYKLHEYACIQPDCTSVWTTNNWHTWFTNNAPGYSCDGGYRCWDYNNIAMGCSWQSGLAWNALLHWFYETDDSLSRYHVIEGVKWMNDLNRSTFWTDKYSGFYLGFELPGPYGVVEEQISGYGQYVGAIGYVAGEIDSANYFNRCNSAFETNKTSTASINSKSVAQKCNTMPEYLYYLSQSTVNLPPVASFTANPDGGLHAFPVTVHFDASGSYDTDGSIVSYTWDFGDDWYAAGWDSLEPATTPPERGYHAISYAGDDKVLLFGGYDNPVTYNDTWLYDLSEGTWTQMNPDTVPHGNSFIDMAYLGGDNILLFGGNDGTTNDSITWVYDVSDNNWTRKNPSSPPTARYGHSMSYIGDDKAFLHSGYSYSGGSGHYVTDRAWIYDLSDNAWTQKNPTVEPFDSVGNRVYHEMIYLGDDQVLIFGGYGVSPHWLGDTWIYDLSDDTWEELNPTTSPPPRYWHTMAPLGNGTAILTGGFTTGEVPVEDTWRFSLSDTSWAEFTGSPYPSGRREASMADVGTGRAILFGGRDMPDPGNYFDDTWLYGSGDTTTTNDTISHTYSVGERGHTFICQLTVADNEGATSSHYDTLTFEMASQIVGQSKGRIRVWVLEEREAADPNVFGYTISPEVLGSWFVDSTDVGDAIWPIDSDAVSWLASMGITGLRFATDSMYLWEDYIGPHNARDMRNAPSSWTTAFGIDEFGALVESLGISADRCLISVGYTNGLAGDTISAAADISERVERAAAWVEYCNADTGSNPHGGIAWADTRSAHGHIDPYGFKYWEIGDEGWDYTWASTYAGHLDSFVSHMTGVDTSIKVGAIGHPKIEYSVPQYATAWNFMVLTIAGDMIDFLSIPYYLPGQLTANPGSAADSMHYYGAATAVQMAEDIDTLRDQIDELASSNVQILFRGAAPSLGTDSLWFQRASLWSALWSAEYRAVWQNYSADWNLGPCFGWSLVSNTASEDTLWSAALVWDNDSLEWFYRPSALSMEMFANNWGDTLVKTTAQYHRAAGYNLNGWQDGVYPTIDAQYLPLFSAQATMDSARENVYLAVWNKHLTDSLTATVQSLGFWPARSCSAFTLLGDSTWQTNDLGDHNSVVIDTSWFQAKVRYKYRFPPHSFNILKMKQRRR